MKLHILSDLHIEFGPFVPPATDADVVVLAGDIHTKGRGVQWALQAFNKPVVMVAGNHDFYGASLSRTVAKMKAAAQDTHVHVLENDSVVIDGVRFIGATLWTDYRLTGNQPLAMFDARAQMADFKTIRDDKFRKVVPNQLLELHMASRNFVMQELEQPFEGKTVVVTHHAPCELSIHPRFKEGPSTHLNAAYASRLEQLFGQYALHVHGHVHDSMDYELYETRVVCNPRGYAGEDLNAEFDPGFTVEI